MKFRIKTSPQMNRDHSPLGSIEDRLIRLPAYLRVQYGLDPGIFLNMKGKNDDPILLRVSSAYESDAIDDPECAYISEKTHNSLDLERTHLVKPSDDILIGCDPEFFLVDRKTGYTISASHFFSHYGEVGSDQGLAELRPRPSFKEKGVSEEIYKLIKKAFHHIQNRGFYRKEDIHLLAASHYMHASAGYHIHYGLPQSMLKASPETSLLMARMVQILDYYVGIPSILPEGNEDFYRRSETFSRYGKPGDHRHDMMTLEYRVPGGHLLRHPILSSGILSISITVMKDMLSRFRAYTNGFEEKLNLKDYEDLRKFYPSLPGQKEVYKCVVAHTIDGAMKHVDGILDDISKMIGYEENSRQIISYFDYVLNYIHKRTKFDENMEANWRLVNEKQPREMAVLQPS